MKGLFNIRNIIILLLLAIVIFGKYTSCGKKSEKPKVIRVEGKPYQVIKHEIDTVEIIKKIFIEKPGEDIYHDTTIYVHLPISIDTLEIIKAYFAKNIYKDTLKLNDSLGFVFIQDTISENKIAYRAYKAEIRERVIRDITYLKEPPKVQVYYGFEGTFDRQDLFKGIGGGFLLKTKKDKIFKLNLGVLNGTEKLDPYANFGMYWKIGKKSN
jgi:hypothetical protein